MTEHLYQAVIYEHPSDFPEHYVVRFWRIGARGLETHRAALLAETAEEARAFVLGTFPDMVLVHGPGVDPDPCIFEVYT
jgi:hypothetical protein